MRQRGARGYLVRDTGTSIAFWLIAGVGVVLVVDAVLRGDPWKIAWTASIAALVIWTLGIVMFHPHIRYDESGVVVTNIGRVHEIPWNHVASVRQGLSLTFELDDGRRISAAGVTAPRDKGLVLGTLTRNRLGAGAADFHKYADAIRLIKDGAGSGSSPVVSRWDLPVLALGAALALAVLIVVTVSLL